VDFKDFSRDAEIAKQMISIWQSCQLSGLSKILVAIEPVETWNSVTAEN